MAVPFDSHNTTERSRDSWRDLYRGRPDRPCLNIYTQQETRPSACACRSGTRSHFRRAYGSLYEWDECRCANALLILASSVSDVNGEGMTLTPLGKSSFGVLLSESSTAADDALWMSFA